ncbi:hypothetical protein GCM10010429_27690 [Micromonospora olivasterospora]|uniref:ABC-2 type transport system ATP-binding protein n=1 Tax=Micromonospora olivasterospora TaxID=1880 RepID=A0A562I4Y4_MICOL|nr:ABC-2 type transport system ATP-binding protein [Micromonospora olivasterospora]
MSAEVSTAREAPGLSAADVIDVRGLRKEFTVRVRAGRLRREKRVVSAVDGIDLRVARGEMLGYIGPNGAGKSTTLKMLTGVLAPSAGEVRVCGLRPVPQRTRLALRIGVVFGQRSQLWWDLPLRDSFDLLRHVYRVPAADHAARLRRCRDLLDLDAFLDTPVRQLSLGQRMRGELTAALLHGPEVRPPLRPVIHPQVADMAASGALGDPYVADIGAWAAHRPWEQLHSGRASLRSPRRSSPGEPGRASGGT